MPPIKEGQGFGSNPGFMLTGNTDYLIREIRGGSFGATITSIFPEIDAGNFIRSAGDATVNGGLVVVARLAIFAAKSDGTPPGPALGSGVGITPASFANNSPSGFRLLWQESVFAWPQQNAIRFAPGEIETTDRDFSLYVVFGGIRQILAGSIAAPGTTSDAPATFALLSVLGETYQSPKSDSISSNGNGLRSLPRYASL